MLRNSAISLCLACALTIPALAAGRGYFGASFGMPPAREKGQSGVVLKKVFRGMAAQRAGLEPGEIVTQINGVPVSDPQTAVALLAENSAGQRVRLTVIDKSGDQPRRSQVVVTLGARPSDEFAKIMRAKPVPPPCVHASSSGSSQQRCSGAQADANR